MKMYDSYATITFCHALMSGLDTDAKREEFSEALGKLFWKKQESEPGEYTTFKLTKEDVQNVFDELFA